MAKSPGPISSSVRTASGQEVSEARPALPAGAGPGWEIQFPADSPGWLAEGSTDHFSEAVVLLFFWNPWEVIFCHLLGTPVTL